MIFVLTLTSLYGFTLFYSHFITHLITTATGYYHSSDQLWLVSLLNMYFFDNAGKRNHPVVGSRQHVVLSSRRAVYYTFLQVLLAIKCWYGSFVQFQVFLIFVCGFEHNVCPKELQFRVVLTLYMAIIRNMWPCRVTSL